MARARPKTSGSGNGRLAKLEKYWYPREYLLVLTFVATLGVGGVWGTWQNLCAGDACPSIAQIRTFQHEQKSKIFAIDGRQIDEIGFESRTPVEIRALP